MKTALTCIVSLGVLIVQLLIQSPAMALPTGTLANTATFAVTNNDLRATAKNAEGRLQSAAGELTGDNAMKIKGEFKQGQSAAMAATEDLKRAAKKAADSQG